MTATANEFFGSDCGSIIACDVMAGDEAASSGSSESSESEQANCNHAAFEGGLMIADFCAPADGDSRMLQCRNGEGFLRTWLQSTNCDGSTWVEEALSDQEDVEVVCDAADPCQLVVFEVYDVGSHSSDSSDYGESSGSG